MSIPFVHLKCAYDLSGSICVGCSVAIIGFARDGKLVTSDHVRVFAVVRTVLDFALSYARNTYSLIWRTTLPRVRTVQGPTMVLRVMITRWHNGWYGFGENLCSSGKRRSEARSVHYTTHLS